MSQQLAKLEDFSVPSGMVDLDQISGMLIEQMKLVSKSPAQIPQAECAVMVAGRIVDIAKTQVSQLHAINELLRTKNGGVSLTQP